MNVDVSGAAWVAAAAPAIYAAVGAAKAAFLPSRFAGLVALALGVGYGAVLWAAGDVGTPDWLLGGITAGSAAIGVHATVAHERRRVNGPP